MYTSVKTAFNLKFETAVVHDGEGHPEERGRDGGQPGVARVRQEPVQWPVQNIWIKQVNKLKYTSILLEVKQFLNIQ